MIPKIVEHSIMESKRSDGSQFTITIPVEFARNLKSRGIKNLLLVYNGALAAFPDTGPETEGAILKFLKAHPELRKIFCVLDK